VAATVTVRLALTVVGPPPRAWAGRRDIEAGLQRGATAAGDVAPGARRPDDGSIRLACERRTGVGPAGAGGPAVLRGPCAFGPLEGRFLSVSWSGVADDGHRGNGGAEV
jgi:hypothetical protein